MSTASKPPIRWWPLVGILFLFGLGVVVDWRINQQDRQQFILVFTSIALAAIALSLIWLVFLSRIPVTIRLSAALILLMAGGVGAACFRIKGVTGDLLPVLEWRWKSDSVAAASFGAVPTGPGHSRSISSNHDFPQFLGPTRNASLTGVSLNPDWTNRSPELLWTIPVGPAWSGFAIAGDYAITQEQQGESEVVAAYDLKTGDSIWRHADSARYETTIGGIGPRATPTTHSNRVYTVGATGWVNCLELETGTALWKVNMLEDNSASVPDWGLSGSPLVDGDRLIVHPGGSNERSLVAYDRHDGDFLWGGGTDGAGYSSPMKATLAGAEQLLIFNANAIASHHPDTGAVLWSYPWRRGHPHVAMPVVLSSHSVFVSSGYGTGSQAIQVSTDESNAWEVQSLWKTIRLKAKFTNVVLYQDHIYGLDDGIMVCLEVLAGNRLWKGDRIGHGQVLLINDILLVLAEDGEVLLMQPNPNDQKILARFRAFRQKTWNPPALAGEYLVVRNDQEASCYRIPLLSSLASE